jgi:hypothetical protein
MIHSIHIFCVEKELRIYISNSIKKKKKQNKTKRTDKLRFQYFICDS